MTITLFNLESSRSFRVHWLAVELGIAIKSQNYKRIDGKDAEPQMAKDAGFNKSPCLVDDADGKRLLVIESNNCMIYLAERYGGDNKTLLPSAPNYEQRSKVLGWMEFSETIVLHGLAHVFPMWFKRPQDDDAVANIHEKAAKGVQKDMDEVEKALQQGPYVCGKDFTAADIALAFSCEFILCNKLGVQDKSWPKIEAWLKKVEARPAFKQVLNDGPDYAFIFSKEAP